MTNASFKALRAGLDAFTSINKLLVGAYFPDEGMVEAVYQLVERTDKNAPGVLLPFNRDAYLEPFSNFPVKKHGLLAYIETAVSLLSVAIEDEGLITAEHLLDFAYIGDLKLRTVLQRDYRELSRALESKCWKSAVVLSGGLIEALLLDQLLRDPSKAIAASSAPKKNQNVLTWRFVELIDVAVELGLVSKGGQKLSHSVRDYRNLIHLHKELKEGLTADEQEARIAFNILNLIDRDLQP